MKIYIIGIGTDCKTIIDRLVKDFENTMTVIIDTEDRLVNATYERIPLQKEFVRKLNRGFYVSELVPVRNIKSREESIKSGYSEKIKEEFMNLVREIISFIGDADMVFIIAGMAGEAGSRLTQQAAFAVKYCSHRKCVVLDRRIEIHSSMPPYLLRSGFMDIVIDFTNLTKHPVKEAQSNRDVVIFNIISHCVTKAREEGIESVSSKSILEKVKGVQIGSSLRMHMKEKTAYSIESKKL